MNTTADTVGSIRYLKWRPDWQPISTAPEGVDVLCHFPDLNEEYQIMISHRLDGHWYAQDSDACPDPIECEPTHWMPLPEAPSNEA